jgi:hypothetical protein
MSNPQGILQFEAGCMERVQGDGRGAHIIPKETEDSWAKGEV